MIGVDAKINTLKTTFAAKLWTDYSYTAYERAFVNERDGVNIPEVFTGGNEYSEVKLDDTLDAQSFFVVSNQYSVNNGINFTADVDIYFAVNLATCYPTISERAVEYVHRDVSNLLKQSSFELTAIESGWGEFGGQYQNMQPFYLVKFTTQTDYLSGECINISEERITETGAYRLTEDGQIRILE